jgi:hypothetical protein
MKNSKKRCPYLNILAGITHGSVSYRADGLTVLNEWADRHECGQQYTTKFKKFYKNLNFRLTIYYNLSIIILISKRKVIK